MVGRGAIMNGVSELVVNTFKRSTAEQVPSECSQLRYICYILEYLFKSISQRVPSESDIPAIHFFGFTKLSAAMLVVERVDCGIIAGYYFEIEESKSERQN